MLATLLHPLSRLSMSGTIPLLFCPTCRYGADRENFTVSTPYRSEYTLFFRDTGPKIQTADTTHQTVRVHCWIRWSLFIVCIFCSRHVFVRLVSNPIQSILASIFDFEIYCVAGLQECAVSVRFYQNEGIL
jgi:hypothetical protein